MILDEMLNILLANHENSHENSYVKLVINHIEGFEQVAIDSV
jgi:hypothetical protein